MICLCFCFFFSSRRRHTRCGRDWSSDVCSSDLETFTHIQAKHYYLQPMADYKPQLIISDHLLAARAGLSKSNTKAAVEYCLTNPKWKLCLQTHKYLEID